MADQGDDGEFRPQSAQARAWLLAIVEGSPIPTFVIDDKHVVTHWNRACEIVTGTPATAVVGTNRAWAAFYPSPRQVMADLIIDGRLEAQVGKIYSGKCRPSSVIANAWEAEDFFAHFPGGGKWLAFTAAALRDAEGCIVGAIETLRDITEERRALEALREGEHRMNEIIDGCSVPMFVIDETHTVTHWNRACEGVIGVPAKDMVGTRNQWQGFYPSQGPVMADLVLDGDHAAAQALYSGECRPSPLVEGGWEAVRHFPHFKSGERWLYFTAAPVRGLDGRFIGAVETLQDITDQKLYEHELERQANHDALTGLANRLLLNDRLTQTLAHAERDERLMALLFIDLDHFKVVNDTLGHSAGDEVVKEVARRIAGTARTGDTVARIGGDEFVVVLYAPESEDSVVEVIRRLFRDIVAPITVTGEELFVGCSIGAAVYPRDGTDAKTLMKHADTAMYRAKESGRGTFNFFTQEMNDRVCERMRLERDLRYAIERNEFFLTFQPQVELPSGRIIGVEVLLRWQQPKLGLIMPDRFIGLAEDTGLIVPIGRWVIDTACRIGQSFRMADGKPLRMSINLSPRQFLHKDLEQELRHTISLYGVGSLYLELELTESSVMKNAKEAARMLASLKEIGVRLSMDDFGTGYSSLGNLRHFPFDMIKIDRSFVSELGQSSGGEAVVRAIISLSHSLGLGVIAEGVETELQRDFLIAEGCEEAQGYFYGRPMTEKALLERLAGQSPPLSRP